MAKNKNRRTTPKQILNHEPGQNDSQQLNEIVDAAHRLVPDIPLEKVGKIVQLSIQQTGPIPPAIILKQYDEIIESGAERIFKTYENQSSHRLNTEKIMLKHDIIQSYAGLFMGFTIAMTVIVFGGIAVLNGKELSGLVALVSGLGAVIGIFIYGRNALNKVAKESNKILPK